MSVHFERNPDVQLPDVTIRRLESEKDAEIWREIRLEALRSSPSAFGSDFASENARPLGWFAERLTTSSVYGGFRADALLGEAGLMPERTQKRAHKGYLWGVYVRPEARSAGVARSVVRAALDHAIGEFEIVHLTVERGNMHARRLYTSLGFQEFGLEKDALKVGDRYYDNILMALDLRPH
jgi:ribosomal protein S18 acetylase RimI-like enzyme